MPYPPSLIKLKAYISEHFTIADPYFIDLQFATIIANKLPMDPVWVMLVAPPASMKTESLQMFDGINDKTILISSMTSRTLISGKQSKKGDESSLLLQLGTVGFFIFKDFTTMISMHKDERMEIMGQLREVYDGHVNKRFGTGELVEWRGKIGVLAGVTYKIHSLRELLGDMGERFILYSIILPDRKESVRQSLKNQKSGKIQEYRDNMKAMAKNVESEVKITDDYGFEMVPKDFEEEINDLAEFATKARSMIERNWKGISNEIINVYPPESPNRFANQLMGLSLGFIVLCGGELMEIHKECVRKIALDSITFDKRRVLAAVLPYDTITTAGLAVKMNLPTTSVRRILEDLNALNIVDRQKGSGNKGDEWELKANYRELLNRYEKLPMVGGELNEDNAIPGSSVLTASIENEEKVNDLLSSMTEEEKLQAGMI